MNCAEAESQLDRLTHPDLGSADVAHGELHKHLAICPACRRALQLIEQWDSKIRPVMSQVAIPAGLTQRLTTALQDHADAPLVNRPSPTTNNPWKQRIRAFATIGVSLFIAASLWWGTQYLPQPMLTAEKLPSLWEQLEQQPLVPSVVEARLPRGWSSLTHVRTDPWQQLSLPSDRLTLPVKPLEIQSKRGPSERGWLLVIPKSRWGGTLPIPLSSARVQYLPRRVSITWNEGENVYIVAVTGSPQSLEQIQRQLELNNSVL